MKVGNRIPTHKKQRKVLDYLAMTKEYRQKRKVKFHCMNIFKKNLEELPHNMDGTAKTLGANQLFNVNDDTKKLPKEQAQLFHQIREKFLYLCRTTLQDIQTAVAFLFTRVKAQTKTIVRKF